MKFFGLTLALLFGFSPLWASPKYPLADRMIVVDAGHGTIDFSKNVINAGKQTRENIPEHTITLAIAEKAGWLASADAFIAARKLRNALVHEYMLDAQNFLESLFAAQKACQMFFDTIETVHTLADQLALAG